MRLMKKYLPTVLVTLIASALLAFACRTNPSTGELEPNWPAITQTVTISADTVESMGLLMEEPKRSAWLALATSARQAERDLSVWIAAGEPLTGAQAVALGLQAVVTAVGPLLDVENDQDLRFWLVGLQGAVKMAAVFVPDSGLPEPTEVEVEAAAEVRDAA
jgi:hypothetical protein